MKCNQAKCLSVRSLIMCQEDRSRRRGIRWSTSIIWADAALTARRADWFSSVTHIFTFIAFILAYMMPVDCQASERHVVYWLLLLYNKTIKLTSSVFCSKLLATLRSLLIRRTGRFTRVNILAVNKPSTTHRKNATLLYRLGDARRVLFLIPAYLPQKNISEWITSTAGDTLLLSTRIIQACDPIRVRKLCGDKR